MNENLYFFGNVFIVSHCFSKHVLFTFLANSLCFCFLTSMKAVTDISLGCFGFVLFSSYEDVKAAITSLNNTISCSLFLFCLN